jgi:hypothetical protein
MSGSEWPMWTEEEIGALSLGYINDIIESKDGYSAFAAVALAHYLVKKVGLNPDNYPIFFRLVESGNPWVIDTLISETESANFLGSIQFNTFMVKECFRMLTAWRPGEIYPKALLIIFNLLMACYKMPEEGYRIFPVSVNDVNNLGKHLDPEKDQTYALNRSILTILDRIASLVEPQRKMPAVEIQDVALQSNNIRGKFLDMTKNLNEAIPDVLLARGNYEDSIVKPIGPDSKA